MRITPLEIRQKTFEKAFRGLDKEEVYGFLQSLSQEWERLMDENKELRIKLDGSEKEVDKLREVENSLFKTLKTAEDTGANMIDQATKTAELHLKETQIRAEAILNEAKSKAKDTIEQAEMTAKDNVEEMEERLKSLAQAYKTLENYRDDLLSDIKNIAQDALEKVDRYKGQGHKFDLEDYLLKAKRESVKVKTSSSKIDYTYEKPTVEELNHNLERHQQKEEERKKEKPSEPEAPGTSSFFDEIE
ncbi:MAG: DivIVA domain-containing protein [Bacteroidota bacterium]